MQINSSNILTAITTTLFIFHIYISLAIMRKIYLHRPCTVYTIMLDMIVSVWVVGLIEIIKENYQ